MFSGEFEIAFFTAVYAVSPEHASDAAPSKSIPEIFIKNLKSGTSKYSAYPPS